jgi:ABC-type dipeptide/oligopeptide/nickel transport system ATPase component
MGKVVEQGPKDEMFTPPHHPYTDLLAQLGAGDGPELAVCASRLHNPHLIESRRIAKRNLRKTHAKFAWPALREYMSRKRRFKAQLWPLSEVGFFMAPNP